MEHPLGLACLNQSCTMKGTEANPTSDKWAIILSEVDKCFLIMSFYGIGKEELS